MTAIDVVNRVFREFKRFTGDGLPNEPIGAPLPVGDPASGPHNPKKADLREALLAPLGEASASAEAAEEWAQSPDPISEAAGGDGVNDRSAKYWADQFGDLASAIAEAEGFAQDAEDDANRAEAAAAGVEYPVSYELQALSAEQQAQARTNIDAVGATDVLQGAWEIIDTINRAAQADIIIRDLDPYTSIRISGYALPVSDNTALSMEFSTDNGATWLTGAADYSYELHGSTNGAGVAGGNNAAFIELGVTNAGNVVGEGIRFTATIDMFNKNANAFGNVESMLKLPNGTRNVGNLGVWANGTTKRRAIRIRFRSGDIASANLVIEGRRDDMLQWRKLPANWEYPPKQVRAAAVWNGKVLFGSDGMGQPGNRAEIWEKTPIGLRKRAGFPGGGIQTLIVGPDNALYLGTGTNNGGTCLVGRYSEPSVLASTGRWDGTAANYEELQTFSADYVWCSAFHGGKLHVGTLYTSTLGAGQVWRLDDPGWTLVGEPGLNGWPGTDEGRGVYELFDFNGELWASTFGDNNEEGIVLRLVAGTWEVVTTEPTKIGLAFDVYDGNLVIALHNALGDITNPIQYWDGTAFVPLGTAPAYFSDPDNFLPNHMVTGPDGNLYVGWGGNLGTLTVWRYDGSEWKQIAGDGLNGSWVNPVAGAPATAEWFYRMIAHGNRLYACAAGNDGFFGAAWEYQLS